ncbi:nitroreductase [Clostridium bovifaecis]|uniref:Nitroreductase n=1 Tax=Clostridium bovifaecis TaxID=2184719 RepID=A0A6I6ESU3_9CLOT|nr:nitroreductase [Clostridium bovifaecis]
MIKELVAKNRSYRRFYESHIIEMDTLKELVDLARLSSSAANLQPLRYILSNTEDKNKSIFETLAWAGYLKDWEGPEKGERPSAYIIMLNDLDVSKSPSIDLGIAAQSILLGAVERNLGGCMIGNIDKKKLKLKLNLEDNYEILLVVALGKPKEEVIIESMDSTGDVKYWRDENSVHHVPKRSLDNIIL